MRKSELFKLDDLVTQLQAREKELIKQIQKYRVDMDNMYNAGCEQAHTINDLRDALRDVLPLCGVCISGVGPRYEEVIAKITRAAEVLKES